MKRAGIKRRQCEQLHAAPCIEHGSCPGNKAWVGAVQIPAFQGGRGLALHACTRTWEAALPPGLSTSLASIPLLSRSHRCLLAARAPTNISRQRGRQKSDGQHPALPRRRAPLLSACGSPAPPSSPPALLHKATGTAAAGAGGTSRTIHRRAQPLSHFVTTAQLDYLML